MDLFMKCFVRCGFVALVSFIVVSTAIADHSHNYQEAASAYESGDYKKAFRLWSSEAEQGSVDAQEMLAAMHATGKGTDQSYVDAVKWYRLAAEQGSPNAQYSLGKMYMEGKGVAESLESAYAWWLVAAVNGNSPAKDLRRAAERKMTPAQIEKAHSIAIEIMLILSE